MLSLTSSWSASRRSRSPPSNTACQEGPAAQMRSGPFLVLLAVVETLTRRPGGPAARRPGSAARFCRPPGASGAAAVANFGDFRNTPHTQAPQPAFRENLRVYVTQRMRGEGRVTDARGGQLNGLRRGPSSPSRYGRHRVIHRAMTGADLGHGMSVDTRSVSLMKPTYSDKFEARGDTSRRFRRRRRSPPESTPDSPRRSMEPAGIPRSRPGTRLGGAPCTCPTGR